MFIKAPSSPLRNKNQKTRLFQVTPHPSNGHKDRSTPSPTGEGFRIPPKRGNFEEELSSATRKRSYPPQDQKLCNNSQKKVFLIKCKDFRVVSRSYLRQDAKLRNNSQKKFF